MAPEVGAVATATDEAMATETKLRLLQRPQEKLGVNMARKRDLKRDAQIHELYRQGLSNAEITRRLDVSPPTVSRVLGPRLGQWTMREMVQRIEMLELEASLLAECAYWFSKVPSPWGQSLGQRIRDILSRWPTPKVRELYQNEKLELHTGYIRDPLR